MNPRAVVRAGLAVALAVLCLIPGAEAATRKTRPKPQPTLTDLKLSAQEYRLQVDDKKSQIELLRRKLSAATSKKNKLMSQEQQILEDLEENDLRLEFIRKELSLYRMELGDLDRRIIEQRATLETARQNEQRTSRMLQEHLRMIYKQNLRGAGTFLLSSQDFSVFLKRLKFLRIVARKSSDFLVVVTAEQEAIQQAIEKDRANKKYRLEIAKMTRQKESEQVQQRRHRSRLLARVRQEGRKYALEVEANKRATQNLKTLIGKLNTLARQAEREAKLAYTFKGGTGTLPWPLKGRVVASFGRQVVNAKLKTSQINQGIEIQAVTGTPVKAIARGRVLYADWLTGYGKMVIVDHGSNFWSLYAHLDEITVREKQDLEKSQQLGLSGETGSMSGPNLYLQIRKNGIPQDPLKWLARK